MSSKILKQLLRSLQLSDKNIFIISISGGKDSKVLLLLFLEIYKQFGISAAQIKVIYCDTGFEHPLTIAEIKKVKEMLNQLNLKLEILTNKKYPNGMLELIDKKKTFPSRNSKFCTEELKLAPAKDYYLKQIKLGYEPIVLIGKRRDESKDRAHTPNKELIYLSKRANIQIELWYPLIYWNETDVFSYLDKSNNIPAIYKELGVKRVGCFPCFQANLKEISLVSEQRIKQINNLETKIIKYRDRVTTFFYRNEYIRFGKMVQYAKKRTKLLNLTFQQRGLLKLVAIYGNKNIRFSFLKYGNIPNNIDFSRWVNLKRDIPQKYLQIIEKIIADKLNKKQQIELLNIKDIQTDNLKCDCESYNLLQSE